MNTIDVAVDTFDYVAAVVDIAFDCKRRNCCSWAEVNLTVVVVVAGAVVVVVDNWMLMSTLRQD